MYVKRFGGKRINETFSCGRHIRTVPYFKIKENYNFLVGTPLGFKLLPVKIQTY